MLDAAATSASRVGSTNYKPTGTARETYIRNYVADQAFGLLDPAQLQVTPTAYASFAAIGQPDAGASGDFGGPGDVVVYTLTYPWHGRSEEHTSELQSLMRISYAVFCLIKTYAHY